jgi:hypothetical protein
MSDRDYPNSGILFRDDSKRSDKDRDYRRDCGRGLPALWRAHAILALCVGQKWMEGQIHEFVVQGEGRPTQHTGLTRKKGLR